MLKVYIPHDNFLSERKYIINVLLSNFLGLDFEIVTNQNSKLLIRICYNNKELLIDDSFFLLCKKYGWLSSDTMPKVPLKTWDPNDPQVEKKLLNNKVPVLYGVNKIETDLNKIHIGIDIFGSSFFMLSRYEELIIEERDVHDRFSAKTSIAYKEKFLDRPIVNEYTEILWKNIKLLWPSVERKKRNYRTLISCDVDYPFDPTFKSAFKAAKRISGDVIKRRSIPTAIQTFTKFLDISFHGKQKDPYLQNLYLMTKILERNNLCGAFYFLFGNTGGKIDGDYDMLADKHLHELIYTLHSQGHEIGLHGSYQTYLSYDNLLKEYEDLLALFKMMHIEQGKIGARQHFLRWSFPETPVIYNRLGITYDTTLTFADHAGFRCGTCFEYQLYDVKNRIPLNLIERPLIAMDATITLEQYMGLGNGLAALEYLKLLKNQCKKHEGDFTFLWHNSFFKSQEDYHLFKEIIQL